MKYLPRYLFILTLYSTSVFSQHIEESKITCSHAVNANSFSLNKGARSQSQSEYDVSYYDIDIIVYPDQQAITGTVGITAKSLVDNLANIEVDLSDFMNVNNVSAENVPFMSFNHENNLIKIDLPNTLAQNEEFSVVVHYQGQPQATGYGSFTFETVNGKPMISTLSEPYGARDWWPCKDTPLDKADSVNISVKVPAEFVVASNGLLKDVIEESDGKTYHWEERYPIATYLVSLAIYPYLIYYDSYIYNQTESMPIEYYVYTENSVPTGLYGKTKSMLTAFAPLFGEYPFVKEKYGHAQFTWGGSMEHQTLSSMGYNQTERTVAHELAHQWWGDMVTCADFHHIWLNEGFATYSEALWNAARDNDMASLHSTMADKAGYYFDYPNGRYGNYSDSRIYVADTTSQSRIFDYSLTYQKGAWVMHMLRHVVGDEYFFDGLQEYGNRFRFKSAVTEDFQQAMEDISGKDLNSFFQQWIYGELYPIYYVKYNQLDDGNLYLHVTQTDESIRQVFDMPVDIVAICEDGSELEWKIKNNMREQYFTLDVPNGKIINEVKFDPEHWILAKSSVIEDATLDISNNDTYLEKFKINSVYPNPFNPTVNISLEVGYELDLSINIYDITGKTVWNKKMHSSPGNHNIQWDGKNNGGDNLPTGTYIIEVSNDKLVKYKNVILLK